MGLSDKKGRLELEITRARGLIMKPGAKTLPSEMRTYYSCRLSLYYWSCVLLRLPDPYVKAYLMDGKNCAEKLKTTVAARKTLDPFYNQILLFMEPYMQKVLQVRMNCRHMTAATIDWLYYTICLNRLWCGETTVEWIAKSSWVWPKLT